MKYGILKANTNTGIDSELSAEFVTPLEFESNEPVFIADTLSLKQSVVSSNVQRWELKAAIRPTNNSADQMVHAVIAGKVRLVYVRVPQVFRMGVTPDYNSNPAQTAITLMSLASKGANTIQVTGNALKKINVGEFINIGFGSKVYLVTAVNTNGDILTVFPSIIEGQAANAPIKYGYQVTMRARYGSESFNGMKYSDGVLMDNGTQTFIEAL